MKKIRKILALVLALSVVLALGVGVFADEENIEYTITVTSGSNNISIESCAYYAYRLFDATYSGDNNENVAYTVNEKFKDFTYEVSDTIFGESTQYGGDNPDTLIDYLRTVSSNSEALDRFAKTALTYITEQNIQPTATATANPVNNTSVKATINVGAPGYYLVTGSAKADNNQLVTAACSLTTAAPTAEIKLKADAPTVDKKIVETVPTEGGVSATEEKLVDANTASIGDKVTYKITTKVPDMTGYDSYWFVIEDTLSPGLKYNSDIEVTINGVKLDRKYRIEGTNDWTEGAYEADAAVNFGKDLDYNEKVTTIEVVLFDFIQYKDQVGDEIVVTYSATVDLDANLDPTVGNPNTVKLIYSNNPNYTYGGDKPDKNTPSNVTGETPEAKVNTFVTGINLTKTDGTDNKLTGAKFQISGTSMKVVLINEEVYKENTSGTYYMLKDGTYTETAPSDTIEANYDSTTTKYKKVIAVYEDTVVAELNTTGYVDKDGVLTFEGLGEGTYTITELIAPDGYNLLKEPITVVISANVGKDSCTWTAKDGTGEDANTIDFDSDINLFPITVVNNAGTELPSTGGMGTTLFYVIGGLLVVCAGVILVTRKRMGKEG